MSNESRQDITCSRLFGMKPKKLLRRLYHDGMITLKQAEDVLHARKAGESAQQTIIRLGLLSHEQMDHYMRVLGQMSDPKATTLRSASGAHSLSDSDISEHKFQTGDDEQYCLNNASEQRKELVLSQATSATGESPKSGRISAPVDREEHGSRAQDKKKKQKEVPVSLGEQLVRDKVITAEQLEKSLARQGRTDESLILILVRSGCVQLSQLGPYVKFGELRKCAVLDLESDYYQGILRIMHIHRRNFRLFLVVCALTILAAVWFHNQIQVFGYLCALAALATVYHRIQRRCYDLQAFFRQTRMTVLNAMDSCTTVGELSLVRDNARAGFATAIALDYKVGFSASGSRRRLGLLGASIVVVFVVLVLLGTVKTPAELRLPGLSQNKDNMQAQPISLKQFNFHRFSGQ